MCVSEGKTQSRQAELYIMSKSEPSTQSAAERRTAEAGLRTLIDRFAPTHLRLVNAMRRSLRKRLPTTHEIVYE